MFSIFNGKAGAPDPQTAEVKRWLFAALLQTATTPKDQRCPQLRTSVHVVRKLDGARWWLEPHVPGLCPAPETSYTLFIA